MNDIPQFLAQRKINTQKLAQLEQEQQLGRTFLDQSCLHHYSYNFDWLGLPIIQFPQDIVAVQKIIWNTRPDIIIETGVARGGSLILSASILQLLNGRGKVIGIDIDIRPHNRTAIEAHPLAHRIQLIQGSSTDPSTLRKITQQIQASDRIMIILDSNHTHEHVLEELNLYSPLVTSGCYLIVMDTIVDDMSEDHFQDRPWGKDNNPKTAVFEFLKTAGNRFEVDETIHQKLMITVAPHGYLKAK